MTARFYSIGGEQEEGGEKGEGRERGGGERESEDMEIQRTTEKHGEILTQGDRETERGRENRRQN